MDNKQFDDIIKSTLDSNTATNEPNHWQLFSERLDQEFGTDVTQIDDAEFDQIIRDEMNSSTSPLDPNAWPKLEKQLELDLALRRKVIVVKSLEFLVLLIVLFTAWNLNLIEKTSDFTMKILPNDSIYTAQIQTGHLKQHSITGLESNSIEKMFNTYSQFLDRNEMDNKVLSKAPKAINEIDNSAQSLSQCTNLSKIISTSETNVVKQLKSNSTTSTITNENFPIEKPANNVDKTSILLDPILKLLKPKEDTILVEKRMPIIMASIPNISTNHSLDFDQEIKEIKIFASITPHDNSKKNNITWLNAYGSADINLINSPFDFVYFTPSYYVDALGTSGGLGISWDNQLNEIDLGMTYSTKSYVPRINEETLGQFDTGYQKTSLNNIFFNTLAIPLNLKIHTRRDYNWSFFVTVGLAANFVINSNYEIKETLLSTPESIVNEGPTIQSRLSQKSFNLGLLEGGSFADNTYFTSSLGIGVQRKLSEQFSVFSQSNYNYHMFTKGIGPNNDRLHALSFQLGVKMAI